VIGWDVISTQMALADAERRFEEQKQIEKELEVVIKEQKELEEKIACDRQADPGDQEAPGRTEGTERGSRSHA
jgi:hypothetical protein